MPIFQTARYQVRAAAVPEVKKAIAALVDYIEANEPGTLMYQAWQQADDRTRFVHLFIFADAKAHKAHGASPAVARFEAVYRPALVRGPVVFVDFKQIAGKK